MGSLGNVQGGIVSDVSLTEKDIGDSLSIFLSQEATSRARWKIVVYVMTTQGRNIAGEFLCRAPGDRGEAPARLVATARIPGAIGWSVSASLPLAESNRAAAAEQARITLSSTKQGGGDFGVHPVKSNSEDPLANLTQFNSPAPGGTANGPIPGAQSGTTLFSLTGQLLNAAVPGANTFVQLFDQPTMPAPGDVPIWSQHLGSGGVGSPSDPTSYSMPLPPGGLLVNSQLWVASSQSADVFVPNPAQPVTFHGQLSTA
jgi:hypothetical protein